MNAIAFKREAKWLIVLTIALPGLAILFTIVWPAIARWFASR